MARKVETIVSEWLGLVDADPAAVKPRLDELRELPAATRDAAA